LKIRRRRGNESQTKNKSKTPHVVSYKFPDNFADVLALPGIGRYTAGAICSIAFNQPTPILDGNVIRLLTRVFGIAKNSREKKTNARLWKLAENLVGRAASSTPRRGRDTAPYHSFLNQSLMELGALICTPRNPKCQICPVKKLCVAFRENRVEELPNLGKRTTTTARRFIAFVVEWQGRFFVRQRPAGVVNAHLWEFPNVECTNGKTDVKQIFKIIFGIKPPGIRPLYTLKHFITRYRITLEAFRVQLGGRSSTTPKISGTRGACPSDTGIWLSPAKLDSLAFTSAHRKILRYLQHSPHLTPQGPHCVNI
jgi:A/G-specific adenine glycosylase